MNPSIVRWSALVASVLLGCNVAVKVNPEGLRCDGANACPDGYSCNGGQCHFTGGSSGGGTASAGGGSSSSGGGSSGLCDGVVCNSPLPPTCIENDTKLRTFTAPGTCNDADGVCNYPPVDIACAKGCLSGMCKDACTGMSCTTPPSAVCKDSSTLFIYAAQGTCSNGACSYTRSEQPCASGCSAGVCQGQNLCTGVVCNMPPAPSCAGNSVRRYLSVGSCTPGTGQCNYGQPIDTACPNGCANATCLSVSLGFTQTMPRVPFAVNAIDIAPQSGGKLVLAVGAGGQAMQWDGTSWSKVAGLPSTAGVKALWFSGKTTAYAVGEGRGVYHYDTGVFTTVPNVPAAGSGAGAGSMVSVHGVNDDDVMMIDAVGDFWRYTGGSWSSFTSANFFGAQLYVEDATHIRAAGRCTAGPCVAFQNATNLYLDVDNGTVDAQGFGAVGPSQGLDAWVGRKTAPTLRHHSHNASGASFGYDDAGVPALSTGEGVIGVTGVSGASLSRTVYVLTRTGTSAGGLFGVSGLGVTRLLLNTYVAESLLSRNEASGVVVAEVLRNKQVNDIFRRGLVTNEALDLGEDWVAAGLFNGGGGTVALAGKLGDLAVRVGNSPTWDFVHYPNVGNFNDAAFGYSGGLAVLVGAGGDVQRYTPPSTFDTIDLGTTTPTLNGVCRASDLETLVVGTGGLVRAISVLGTPVVKTIATGTTVSLNAVDCPVQGDAVACGGQGTVLRIRNGVAAPVTPSLNSVAALTTCRLVGSTIYVAGQGLFARLDTAAPSPKWDLLNPVNSPRRLQVLAPNDVYAISAGNSVAHFDGNAWNSSLVLPATAILGGGSQMGSKVVFAGNSGVLVESP